MLWESLAASGWYLLRIIPIIAASVIAAELLVRLGALERLSFLAGPVSRFSHLSGESGVALITAFLSPTAASAMLRDFYEQGVISRRELVVASLARAFPLIVSEARYMLPTLLPILGAIGLWYYGTWVGINLTMTFIACLLGYFLLPRRVLCSVRQVGADPPPLGKALRESAKESFMTLRRIFMIMIPATVGGFMLADLGVFEALAKGLSGISAYLPFPPGGMAVLATYIASPIASYPLAAKLLTQGVIAAREVIVIFLLGSILAFPLRLRQLIPHYLGIYGPRPGLELLSLSFGLRSLVTLAAVVLIMS